jgi:dTDP-4-dehydrorhamnose 3,5-epimerase
MGVETLTLNDKTRTLLLLPPYYVNAHLCMTNECIFHYKQTTAWNPDREQYTIAWNDEFINTTWPITNPILSNRDKNAHILPHYLKYDINGKAVGVKRPEKIKE